MGAKHSSSLGGCLREIFEIGATPRTVTIKNLRPIILGGKSYRTQSVYGLIILRAIQGFQCFRPMANRLLDEAVHHSIRQGRSSHQHSPIEFVRGA